MVGVSGRHYVERLGGAQVGGRIRGGVGGPRGRRVGGEHVVVDVLGGVAAIEAGRAAELELPPLERFLLLRGIHASDYT